MTATEAQKKAVKKYQTEKTDEFKIRVPKGQKDVFKAHADSMGESLNAFVIRAINEAMKRDLSSDKPSKSEID